MTVEPTIDFLQTGEVARRFGVSPTTVHLWVRTGRLPAVRTTTGVRLFHREDVDRFAHEREAMERGK